MIEVIASNGALGAVAAAMAYYIAQLSRERRELERTLVEQTEKRTEDAKRVVGTVLELSERHAMERQDLKEMLIEINTLLATVDRTVAKWTEE